MDWVFQQTLNISDANYWKTENDLKIYCNNFYSQGGLLNRYDSWNAGPYSADGSDGSDTQAFINYNRRMNGENTLPSSGGGCVGRLEPAAGH